MTRIFYDPDSNCTIAIHKEDDLIVADCPAIGVASQGATTTEALDNLKEAASLYLEAFSNKKSHKIIITIIESGEDGFSAYSPHQPNCVATGKTYDEVLRNMSASILMNLEHMSEEPISPPFTFSLAILHHDT